MAPKERVLTAVNHCEPDKVPKLASFAFKFSNELREYFEIKKNQFNSSSLFDHELGIALGKYNTIHKNLVNIPLKFELLLLNILNNLSY